MIELSWLNNVNPSLPGSYITDDVSIQVGGDVGGITSRSMYLRNNSTETGEDAFARNTAYDLGFYVSEIPGYPLDKIMEMSSREDLDGKPYGLFILFGATNSAGTISSRATFLAGSMSKADMAKFHVNWSQGTSPDNAILLDSAWRFQGPAAVKDRNFEPFTSVPGGIESVTQSQLGIIQITLALRVPEGTMPLRTLGDLSISFAEVG